MYIYCVRIRYHVFEASEHRSSNDAQEKGHNVQDSCGPQQVVQVHHVLAAFHICIFVVASDNLDTASPVGETERMNGQATKVLFPVSMKTASYVALSIVFRGWITSYTASDLQMKRNLQLTILFSAHS